MQLRTRGGAALLHAVTSSNTITGNFRGFTIFAGSNLTASGDGVQQNNETGIVQTTERYLGCKQGIRELQLRQEIKKLAKENLLAFGNPGAGKSHLLCAIAQELISSQRRKIKYTTCALLVQDLLVARCVQTFV